MFTCIIIDDEPQAIELLRDHIELLYKEIDIKTTCTQWSAALQQLRSEKYDIIFLDISMQGKSGMDLLRFVPGIESEVIFITAYTDYALEAFKLSAAGYIVKPIDEEQFIKTVDRSLERIRNKRLSKTATTSADISPMKKIGIPNNNAIDYVLINDIIYLEADRSCTKIVTTQQALVSSYNIGKFREILDSANFHQVHRSYIINQYHIRRYETVGVVIMSNNDEIPVAKNYRDEFLTLFSRVNNDDNKNR